MQKKERQKTRNKLELYRRQSVIFTKLYEEVKEFNRDEHAILPRDFK